MPQVLPSFSAYLRRLPDGLDSYPDCKAKATLYQSFIDTEALAQMHVMPPPLQRLLEHPPPISAWIPEVHSHALLHASRDLFFDSDKAYLQQAYDNQRALFSGPLYRIMLAVASPKLLFRAASTRWNSFHRGAHFQVDAMAPGSARLRIEHEPHLWDSLMADAMMRGLEAVLHLSGAADAKLVAAEQTPTKILVQATWTG